MLKNNKDAWPLIKFFWEQNPPDSSHIRSYNDFISKIPDLANKTIEYEDFKCEMTDIKFIAPTTKVNKKNVKSYPSTCILEKETYESEVTTVFKLYWKGKLVKEEENIVIGTIPVMVGSELCNLNYVPKKNTPEAERYNEAIKLEFKTRLGGWFVKDGTSRVITFQERSKFNHPMAFNFSKSSSKSKKYNYIVEVRNSVTEENTTSVLTACKHKKNNNIYIQMKYLDEHKQVPALLFFHALGYTDPLEILSFIIHKDDPILNIPEIKMELLKMFELSDKYDWVDVISKLGREWPENFKDIKDKTQRAKAIADLPKQKMEYVEELMSRKFLHHYDSKKKKAYYYGFILYNLLSLSFQNKEKYENINFIKPEDRDHFGKKVLNTESVLFSNVFYSAVRKMVDVMEKNIIKSLEGKSEKLKESVVREMNSKIIFPESDVTKMPISSMLSKALTNNMWGNQKRDGVSTVFDPMNYNNAVVLMMRSCLPIKSFNSKLAPRMVHGSFWGIIDFFDTPEGENIGYNKVLSTSAYISNWIDIENIEKWLLKKVVPLDKEEFDLKHKKVIIDNYWIGSCTKEECLAIYKTLKMQKRGGRIDPCISIIWNDIKEELHIFAQEGRVLRPWLIVENGKILLTQKDIEISETWEDLLALGKIEMLDQNELEFCRVACASINDFYSCSKEKRKQFDYCDIHPATLFGPGAGSVTSPQMTQGPRNSYGANMERQAIGTTTRFDSPRTLFYPQRALVRNKIASLLLFYDENPAGINVTVAFLSGLGFEEEDGYIMNKGFIDLGGGMTNKITKHVIEIDGDNERTEIPKEDECFKFKPKDISNLDENGIIKKGSVVGMNEPLCGKTIPANNGNFKKMDTTLFHRENTTCYVQDVIVKRRGYKDSKIIKIILRETRFVKCGNKFSPRSAQKGTITYICPKEDMPFDPCPYGTPTITMIANPLCIPSRMTICYLEEMFLGNYVCLPDVANLKKGKKGVYNHKGFENCTPYDEDPVERYKRVKNEMKRMGFRSDGKRELIDGRTGEIISTDVFTGQVHMQVLKHMVDDKVTKRAIGPIASLMKCPTEGRSKDGGVKTGTMEKDTIAGNDCPEILLDRLCTSSDQIRPYICKYCGIIESYNKMNSARCKSCKKDDAMKLTTMSNSPKVVFQELMAVCVAPRILLKVK
jgi:DNA-directed RNA polymerase II subunit RPB2